MNKTVIAALYQFIPVKDPYSYREKLLGYCLLNDIKGTLILAEEGINGTVSGTRYAVDGLRQILADLGFNALEYKESFEETSKKLFYRMKIKIKKEIVTMDVPNLLPNEHRGLYLSPQEWHELIQSPDVIILDTRNNYEYNIGTFRNAINPDIMKFRDFPQYLESHRDEWQNKRIAMFCTGGIRCEKSTSFATQVNIGKEVYHLKGGILKYLEEIPEETGLWDGQCYVFDYRVSVSYGLVPGNYKLCFACRLPITEEDTLSPHYEYGVSCPHCWNITTKKQKQGYQERMNQLAKGSCVLGMKL
ncbi:MAG: rhodanese-related sulfurtransferase [Brevinemataceae bacterium]